MYVEHENHPLWVVFVFGIFPSAPMHAEHNNAPARVHCCVWHLVPATAMHVKHDRFFNYILRVLFIGLVLITEIFKV
jgi:hypothetical protein